MDIKKIILIDNEVYSHRHVKLLGIEHFMEWGYDVEVWDCHRFLYASMDILPYNVPYLKELHCFDELECLIKSVDVSSTMFIINPILSLHNIKLFKWAKKHNIFYIRIDLLGNHVQCPFDRFFKIKFTKQYLQSLKIRIENRIVPFVFPKVCLLPSFTLTSCYTRMSGKCIPYNHPDYEEYCFGDNERVLENDYMVFLDFYFPYHPDLHSYYHVDTTKVEKRYKDEMERLFIFLEKKYNMPIVIAAHPKAQYDSSAFGGRKIIYGNSCKLVKYAKMAITHGSNTFSYITLAKCPVMLVTSDDINDVNVLRRKIEWLSKYFEIPIWNISKLQDYQYSILSDVKVEKYIKRFLTTNKTNDVENKQSLMEFMNMLKIYNR